MTAAVRGCELVSSPAGCAITDVEQAARAGPLRPPAAPAACGSR